MENVIVFIVMTALAIFGGMTLSQNFLASVDVGATGITAVEERDLDILRTNLTALTSNMPNPTKVEISLKNSGQVKLADFTRWDVIVQYYGSSGDYHIKWLPYVSSNPGNQEWTVSGIYLNAGSQTPEVYEPGILNINEEMIIEIKLVDPAVGSGYTDLATITTPNGVATSITFTR